MVIPDSGKAERIRKQPVLRHDHTGHRFAKQSNPAGVHQSRIYIQGSFSRLALMIAVAEEEIISDHIGICNLIITSFFT